MDNSVVKKKIVDNVPIIREFPDMFPKEFSGVPPKRQVELQINLIPSAATIAKEPYCLAPPIMHELSIQLYELLDKGFIRPISS